MHFYRRAGWGWWFRILGYGMHVRDTRNPEFRLLFSERNGLRRTWRVGPYIVKGLARGR